MFGALARAKKKRAQSRPKVMDELAGEATPESAQINLEGGASDKLEGGAQHQFRSGLELCPASVKIELTSSTAFAT